MRSTVLSSILSILVLTLLTGLAYPLLVTGVASALFPDRAHGDLVEAGGAVRGARFIGQEFRHPTYFWGRPSATSPPYNAAASSGSNLGPSNPALAEAMGERVEDLRATDGGAVRPVPVDLVTTSASGLDPHITPAGARFQIARVAAARGVEERSVAAIVESRIEPRFLGIFGEARVNVLLLNLDLDQTFGATRSDTLSTRGPTD